MLLIYLLLITCNKLIVKLMDIKFIRSRLITSSLYITLYSLVQCLYLPILNYVTECCYF